MGEATDQGPGCSSGPVYGPVEATEGVAGQRGLLQHTVDLRHLQAANRRGRGRRQKNLVFLVAVRGKLTGAAGCAWLKACKASGEAVSAATGGARYD